MFLGKLTKMDETEIIGKLVQGKPQKDIAKDHGVTQPAIANIKKKYREKIEEYQLALIEENVEPIKELITNIIQAGSEADLSYIGKDESTFNLNLAKLAQTSAHKLLDSIGITSQNPSQIHQEIHISGEQIMLSENLQGILANFIEKRQPEDAIEVDYGVLEHES
jgi:predicted transcriptional regulator